MSTLRKSFFLLAIFILSGCSAFSSFDEVKALNEAQAVGSPFTQYLSSEYRQFANEELKDKFDYPDALHFARKGLSAASGAVVLPESVDDWNLSQSDERLLTNTRARLITLYDTGARETFPELSAATQANFDCWIEQQEEMWDSPAIDCRDETLKLLSNLEHKLPRQVAQPAPAPKAIPVPRAIPVSQPLEFNIDPTEPMAPENAVYLVFFDWDSFKLGAGSDSVLDSIAREVAENPPRTLNIIGHTDTSGSKLYNQRLAIKRSQIVRDALIKRGVSADLMAVDAKGENDLLVNTADGVREPANRRVSISFD